MSKINARSPFYLSFGEPTVTQPTLDCEKAKGNNFTFSITERGELVYNDLAFGSIVEITSADADFVNGEFADETTVTSRTVVLKISIPTGFLNTSDGFINCEITVDQPAYVAGTTCTINTTLNGTIADTTLTTAGGTSSALDLSTKFTEGSSAILGYRFYNNAPDLVSVTAVSATGGKSQSVQFTALDNCGTGYVHFYALDALTRADGSGSCTAHQQAKIIVNGCGTDFACSDLTFSGGSIAQSDGKITRPNSNGTFAATAFVSLSSDGSSPISGVSTLPVSGSSPIIPDGGNTTSGARTYTLYFKMLIPSGYNNTGDGNQYIWCNGGTFTQQAPSTKPAFVCSDANHHNFLITDRGAVVKGNVSDGWTIKSWTPLSFNTVDADTNQTVTFTLTTPNNTDYSNPNTDLTTCTQTIKQPVYTPLCVSDHTFYLTYAFSEGSGSTPVIVDCTKTYTATQAVTSAVSFANLKTSGVGARICDGGSPFIGKNLFYGVRSFSTSVGAGLNAGLTTFLQINNYGIIQRVVGFSCSGGGTGEGADF